MKKLKIREEEWGIGIRYELPDGFVEVLFDKERIFENKKVKNLKGLEDFTEQMENGGLDELIKNKVHKSIIRGVKISLI